MAEAKRPLPNPKEFDTRDFWAATKNKELTYQTCNDCSEVVFYPRAHCTKCGSASLARRVASGKGSVYTYSVVRQSYHPFFRDLVPYAVAWIDLDEGPRLMSNVIGVDDPSSQLRCGQRVELEWEEHDELSIPLFRAVETN